MIYLAYPVWLVLVIPFALLLYLLRLPTRLLTVLRAIILLLLILALCRPVLQIPGRGGTVVVVADRSRSMPLESLEQQNELVGIIQSAMSSRNRLAVVSFGKRADIEQPPQSAVFPGFVSDPGGDQSRLAEGIDRALSLIPKDSAGRIVVLSDGRWTGVDPAETAVRAASRGLAVDYRLMERSSVHDCAIHRIIAPEAVLPGESYLITAWIYSPVRQDIRYRLLRGETELASGTKAAVSGLSRLVFRDTAASPGTRQYTLLISGSGEDPVPENNQARIIVGIKGTRPFLCVRPLNSSGLAGLLKRSGMDIVEKNAADCSWTLEELGGYSGVLLENISASDIGVSGMERLAAWVTHTGSGLMMTGGKNAYGPGGYFRSPLDPVMPVSMELKQEHRKFRLAIAIAMDRSGSMGMSAGPGRTKMDLANIGAVQVLDLLSDQDEIGVIAVDSSPHIIVNLDLVSANRAARGDILSIDSMGGGIFVYEALSAAATMLMEAQAGTRHIILFADAADSEEPWKYKELLENCAKANITVSVIGLGTQHDQDAPLLEDIARRGNGQIFFTEDASEIPRLFAQDTFSVSLSAFIEEQTPIKVTGGYTMLSDALPEQVPDIGGYSLCYLKADANLAALTCDEYEAPVVASWYAGRGRVLCYTGEADGEFTGPIAAWAGVGEFISSMARWTAGERTELPDNMLVVQQVRDGVCRIELHLDPEREREPFSSTPSISILRGTAGISPDSSEMQMKWEHADLLSADLPMGGSETVLASVCIPGMNPVTLSPVRLPYSPEYAPPDEGKGRPALQQLADITGGKERADMTAVWKELPLRTRHLDFSLYLILAALILFLLEILQRRTGILSGIHIRKQHIDEEGAAKEKWIRLPDVRALLRSLTPKKKTESQVEIKEKTPAASLKEPASDQKETQSALSAMKKASSRAKNRTRKE